MQKIKLKNGNSCCIDETVAGPFLSVTMQESSFSERQTILISNPGEADAIIQALIDQRNRLWPWPPIRLEVINPCP